MSEKQKFVASMVTARAGDVIDAIIQFKRPEVLEAAAKALAKAQRLAYRTKGKGKKDKAELSWKPLKPETIRRKVNKGYPEDILKEKGDLYKSLKIQTGPKSIKIYFDDPKAVFHQFGTKTKTGKVHIPKRRLLWTPKEIPKSVLFEMATAAAKKALKLIFGIDFPIRNTKK